MIKVFHEPGIFDYKRNVVYLKDKAGRFSAEAEIQSQTLQSLSESSRSQFLTVRKATLRFGKDQFSGPADLEWDPRTGLFDLSMNGVGRGRTRIGVNIDRADLAFQDIRNMQSIPCEISAAYRPLVSESKNSIEDNSDLVTEALAILKGESRALPTDNRNYGFWGTVALYQGENKTTDAVFEGVSNELIKRLRQSPLWVRDYLDSRYGRHLADMFNEHIKNRKLKDAAEATKEASDFIANHPLALRNVQSRARRFQPYSESRITKVNLSSWVILDTNVNPWSVITILNGSGNRPPDPRKYGGNEALRFSEISEWYPDLASRILSENP